MTRVISFKKLADSNRQSSVAEMNAIQCASLVHWKNQPPPHVIDGTSFLSMILKSPLLKSIVLAMEA